MDATLDDGEPAKDAVLDTVGGMPKSQIPHGLSPAPTAASSDFSVY